VELLETDRSVLERRSMLERLLTARELQQLLQFPPMSVVKGMELEEPMLLQGWLWEQNQREE
jgi:hypothetical protein